MGLRDWADKLKKAAQKRVEDAGDRKKVNENRQAVIKKGIQLANKGAELIKSAEGVNKAVSQKAADIAGAVGPLAEKIDEKASSLKENMPTILTDGFSKAKGMVTGAIESLGGLGTGAKDAVVDTAGKVVETVSQKFDEAQKAKADHPSTGSSLLDFAAGMVPETDATKAKPKIEPKIEKDKCPPNPPQK